MDRIPDLGLLVLVFSSACVTRQTGLEFAGQWRVVALQINGGEISFPATVVGDVCTNGYEIWVESDGMLGEVHYDYSYDCGAGPVYYSLQLPVTVTGDAGITTVEGIGVEWACSSVGANFWEYSRLDGAVLALEPV